MPKKDYAEERTERAKARGKRFPGDAGAKQLAKKLGCSWVSVYDWERPGSEHLPKNARLHSSYLKLIGLSIQVPA